MGIDLVFYKLDQSPSKKSTVDDSIATEPGPVGLQRASKIVLDKKLIPDDPSNCFWLGVLMFLKRV